MNDDKGNISDGYHTFNELYEHRHELFICLMRAYPSLSWASKLHSDGSSMEGWFIAGMRLPTGDITYHLPESYWGRVSSFVPTLHKGHEWDGHTSNDVIYRLKEWSWFHPKHVGVPGCSPIS